MRTLIGILAGLAILANAVIYGTDVFGAIVLRPAIAAVDDRPSLNCSVPIFQELYADPARLKQFAGAMSAISHGASIQIAAQFPWSDYKSFVD